jgi:sulfate adenylyltransferase subunit 1 (EFTu-like GTPase family)
MNNPATRQAWILEQLTERPTLSYVEVLADYRQKWAKSKATFDKDWNKATEQHKQRQQAINKAKEEAIISEEVKAAKNGLKSKYDRLMILQGQVDATLTDLEDRDLSKGEKVLLRRVLRELQAEISRIQGDYAPSKLETTNKVEFSPIPNEDE